MAWRRPGDKPLSELMVVTLPTHICVTRPQWVKPMVTMTYDAIWRHYVWKSWFKHNQNKYCRRLCKIAYALWKHNSLKTWRNSQTSQSVMSKFCSWYCPCWCSIALTDTKTSRWRDVTPLLMRYGVSHHRRLGCLPNCLFGHRSKKTSKICVTGICERNSTGNRWIPFTKGQ